MRLLKMSDSLPTDADKVKGPDKGLRAGGEGHSHIWLSSRKAPPSNRT